MDFATLHTDDSNKETRTLAINIIAEAWKTVGEPKIRDYINRLQKTRKDELYKMLQKKYKINVNRPVSHKNDINGNSSGYGQVQKSPSK